MTLKQLKYVIYGEDRLSGKLKRINGASSRTNQVLGKTNTRLSNLKTNLHAAAGQVPFLNRSLAMLINPITILGGISVGLAIGLNKATNEAIRFNSTFRELKNLNLDKTAEDLASLKQEVLDLSFLKGFDPNQVSTGFFDIQSVTGKYGEEVKRIVSKQGEFAKLMQADFNSYIAGTGVAMANYGFGADQLDEYNRSAYGAFKVGQITYDELAKITPVYAGSAAAAKQEFNSANKLLALFTVKTKSAREAATLTMSAFRDLFKEETIKSFERVGVKMFDEISGKARQVDQIMLDLNNKFMVLNGDQQINALRNQFKGSEGLIALVNAASDQSGNLLRTFQLFDDAEVSLDTVMANAREDLDYINQQLQARTKVLMIEIGQNIFPAKRKWLNFKNGILTILRDITIDPLRRHLDPMMMPQGLITSDAKEVQFSPGKAPAYQGVMDQYKADISGAKEMSESDYIALSNQFIISASEASMKASQDTKLGRAYYRGQYKAYEQLSKNLFNAYNADESIIPPPEGGDGSGGDGDITKGLSGIAGGGTQQKNITVNISKFFDEQNINVTNLTEAGPEIEEKIRELIVRSVNGAEQMLN